MAIAVLQNLPRSPQILAGEADKYLELIGKYTALTTDGNETWTSPSSGIIYSATTGGEGQLLSLLQNALDPYLLNATKWNSIQLEINSKTDILTTDLSATKARILMLGGM